MDRPSHHSVRRCATSLLLAVALVPPVSGQFADPVVLLPPVSGPQAVTAADLDGDGDLDALSASSGDHTLAWYEYLGGEAFGPGQVITSTAMFATSVHTADLDGDGDADVLSTSRGNGVVAWYENLGGTFGQAHTIGTLAGPSSVDTTDVDQDGDPDVLATSDAGPAGVVWYENLGGSFGPERVITTAVLGASCVHCADLDGDGREDALVAGRGDDRVTWYRSLGGGTFGPGQLITTQATAVRCVRSGDLDGDGDLDVVSAGGLAPAPGNLFRYENLGGGVFGSPVNLGFAYNLRSVFVADVEHDGDQDVLFAGPTDGAGWYENDGNGTFCGCEHMLSRGVSGDRSVYAADFDQDGDVEVLTASFTLGLVTFRANQYPTAFGSLELLAPAPQQALDALTLDYDHDGDADVLTTTWEGVGFPYNASQRVLRYENLGGGVLGPPLEVLTTQALVGELQAADLDGDGLLDLVHNIDLGAAGGHRCLGWFPGQVGGTWGSERIVTDEVLDPQLAPGHVAIGDLEGDGDADLVVATTWGAEVVWFENLGAGVFSSKQVLVSAPRSRTVHLADLEGDGDPDLLVAQDIGLGLALFENLGSGSFGPGQVLALTSNYVGDLETVDLDADGRLDVLYPDYYWGDVSWLRNLGGLGFAPAVALEGRVTGARSTELADFDLDGDPDILAAGAGDHAVVWYENQGGGAFGRKQVVTVSAHYPTRALATDFDSDGDPDVLIAGFSDSTGRYLLGWCANPVGLEPALFCGGSTACPCGNESPTGAGRGCVNSTGVGAWLSATGVASVSADSLRLTVRGAAPSAFGIFVQNVGPEPGVGFYDGTLCLARDLHLLRHLNPPGILPTRTNPRGVGTSAHRFTSGDYLGDTLPGRRMYYQYMYRDETGPCGSGANFSGGLSLYWLP